MSTPSDQMNRGGFYRAIVKRYMDLVAGSLLLVLSVPLVGMGWLLVKLSSHGPGFYAQERIGVAGKYIVVYKLRTMVMDQESRVDINMVRDSAEKGVLFKPENDPRVTGVGQFLRRFSIDELPQLWNVVRGDMSLVGPRPLVPFMLKPYPQIQQQRQQVKPGITGPWQISARENNRARRQECFMYASSTGKQKSYLLTLARGR